MQKKTVYPEWVQQYRTKGTTVKKSEILIISVREPRKGLEYAMTNQKTIRSHS